MAVDVRLGKLLVFLSSNVAAAIYLSTCGLMVRRNLWDNITAS
jgi:hypothetical protein